jgi:hypothetical protein
VSNQLPLPAPPPERPEVPPPPTSEEVEAPPSTSHVPLVVGMLLATLAFVGAFVVFRWIAAPSACADANVRSDRFGYCITAPPGWRVAEPQGGTLSSDELFRPAGDTTLTIQAVETGRDLNTFVNDVRSLQRSSGLDTGAVTSITVDGVQARVWDASIATTTQSIGSRTVVFERDGFAWRVQFADSADAFDTHVADLARILGSWHFV